MKNWVFDLDGTLVDSFGHYFSSLEQIFKEHGFAFSDDHRLPALSLHLPAFFRQELGSHAVVPALSRLQSMSLNDARSVQPFFGIVEIIDHLRTEDSRIAVWTSREMQSAEIILKETGLNQKIELCVSGSCVSKRKPDPEGLLRILDTLNWDPALVTMVGDHQDDVLAAKQVGARAVRASWHAYWEMAPCQTADFQFHKVEDFSRWVLGPGRLKETSTILNKTNAPPIS